ncbi:ABC transporter permease [Nocardioides sp. YIM 152315]|uniref:ABC transporter permease n=1 Tax=Nocardioides sp. YIM 152315 TaxID=3031760 RepID=UPI0023DB0B10|nr:ABC transporter permease [Nocardioides sp. YIM 152315]MDF1604710.1 ABC transporter permease [Nocardioides sp. YIM 152315]
MSETVERPVVTVATADVEMAGVHPDVDVVAMRRKPRAWRGALLFVLGLVVAGVAVAAIRDNGWVQLVVILVGLGIWYAGAAELGRVRFGPGFDLLSWLCATWLVVLVLAAIFAPLLPFGESEDLTKSILAPANATPDLLSDYPLGTNNFGLDLLARVVYGARASLVVSIGAVVLGMVVGGAIGVVAGYYRRAVDAVIGIGTNSLLAVPPLILLIALATVLDPTLYNIAFALSLLALPSMIRMARANTMAFSQREFVLASKSMGASSARVMLREIVPNVVLPLASYAMVMVSVLIVAEASLSFLGLGVQAPSPSWGNMIAEGEGDAFKEHPHIVLVPGTVLFLTVFSFNLLGEKARKRFDSRAAKL